MKLKKLDHAFYANHGHLKEALDNHDGNWEKGKTRGYGVVVIQLNQLTFAIPLRTNIKHSAAYITLKSNQPGVKGKGLDFSKALLISDPAYVADVPFKIPPAEFKKLRGKERFITEKFEKYVKHYIEAVQHQDENRLSEHEYRFTTLINYHQELGL